MTHIACVHATLFTSPSSIRGAAHPACSSSEANRQHKKRKQQGQLNRPGSSRYLKEHLVVELGEIKVRKHRRTRAPAIPPRVVARCHDDKLVESKLFAVLLGDLRGPA